MTSDADWARAVALVETRFGRLDILVNNAGIGGPFKRVDRLNLDDWDKVLAVNLTGTLRGIQAAVPLIRKGGRGGSIINMSSVAGIKAVAGLSAYVASKFAVRGLTKSAALDLGVEGIRVNSIHPGVIETDLSDGTPFQATHLALPRKGQASEIADLVVFLASDRSSYATGAEFVCDGGEVAGSSSAEQETSDGRQVGGQSGTCDRRCWRDRGGHCSRFCVARRASSHRRSCRRCRAPVAGGAMRDGQVFASRRDSFGTMGRCRGGDGRDFWCP